MNREEYYIDLISTHTPFENDHSLVLKLHLTVRALTECIVEDEKMTDHEKVADIKALLSAQVQVMERYACEAARHRVEALDIKQLS